MIRKITKLSWDKIEITIQRLFYFIAKIISSIIWIIIFISMCITIFPIIIFINLISGKYKKSK